MSKNKGFFLVISAPSGTGKTSLCRALMAKHPSLEFVVSHTSRLPRGTEEEGKDYYFVSHEEFRHKAERGDFWEWVEHYGNLYGTSKAAVDDILNRGKDVIFDVEPRGAKSLKVLLPGEGLFIFIMPPSLAELRKRLEKRASEGAEQIARRLALAESEMREAGWYDRVIVNDDFARALLDLEAIYLAGPPRRQPENNGCGQINRNAVWHG